jgi:D-xylose transport system substrate-binding protein
VSIRASERRVPQLRAVSLLAGAVLAASLAGCAGSAGGSSPDGGTGDEAGGKIALLLPDVKTARYETFDRPMFENRIAELGPYEVLYANADQDAAKQQQQAESALAAGADVLVLDPVDSHAAVTIVTAANAEEVPVVSYDRLIAGGDLAYYVSFDNEKVGTLQATAFVDALAANGDDSAGILMVNGSPTDNNAMLFAQGAHQVIDETDLRILAEYETPDWSPDKAQEWVAGQISQYGDAIAGVYAANDGIASGAIAALRAANVRPMPVVTGQDAELPAIQRILTGDQYMTVYKAIKPQAELAAEVAVALLKGEKVSAPLTIEGTPATLLDPVAVTVDNIRETVIADGFWTIDDICTPEFEDACAAAGLREG